MYHQRVIDASRERIESVLGLPLKEHSYTDVKDFAARMRDITWDVETGNPSRALSDEEQRFIVNELYMSRVSFPYWLERYCMILSDTKHLVPLVPWPSQKKLFDAIADEEVALHQDPLYKKIKIILLKSRQVGGTAGSEALLAHMVFLNTKTQGIIASDHPDNTQKLWQTLLRIYDNLPGWMRPHKDAKVKATHLHLDRIESDVVAGSGNQKTTLGQGMNVDVAHLTEVSTWIPEMSYAIDADLMPAFDSSRKHHSVLMLESTGAGAKGNWYYEQFHMAQSGKSRFRPVFVAWYLRPGWKESAYGLTFTEQTLSAAERIKRESGHELSKEQLAFYQLKRQEYEGKGNLELFFQEYPSTIEEAFQTGLRSAFPIEVRTRVRDACRTPIGVYEVDHLNKKLKSVDLKAWKALDDSTKADNKLLIWDVAKRGDVHIVGVDASWGVDGGNSGAIEVLRVGNKWNDDEQVAEWRGNVTPLELAGIVEIIGDIYKDKIEGMKALVAVETNPGTPGIVTQTELMRRGYPNFYIWRRPLRADGAWTKEFGWWTTPHTRPLLTEMGVDYITKGYLKVNSPFLVEEMGSFVNTWIDRGKKHLEHAPGYHDDRLIALFIALYIAHEGDMKHVAEQRRRAIEERAKAPEAVVELQTLGLGWEEAISKWNDSLKGLY